MPAARWTLAVAVVVVLGAALLSAPVVADLLPLPTLGEEATAVSPAPALTPTSPAGQLGSFLRAAGIALLLTVSIETPIIAAAGRFSGSAWLIGVLVNTLTNPLGFWLTSLIRSAPGMPLSLTWASIGLIELAVVAVEWQLLKWALGWPGRRALAVSLVANAASFGAGLVLRGAELI